MMQIPSHTDIKNIDSWVTQPFKCLLIMIVHSFVMIVT